MFPIFSSQMFPNVLQQEIVNYLNICQDAEVLQFFKKASKKIWMIKNSKKEIHTYGDYKYWTVNSVLHREYGPAIKGVDESFYIGFYLNGQRVYHLPNLIK